MITFYDEIKKAYRPTYQEVTRKIRALIEWEEPRLARIFARFWNGQQNAITYQELRVLIQAELEQKGVAAYLIDSEYMQIWRQEYAKFVNEKLVPEWQAAMKEASKNVSDMRTMFVYDTTRENVKAWTEQYAAEKVVQLSTAQRDALNGLVQVVATNQDILVDDLARAIRPTVGLYPAQASANFKYYQNVRKTLLENNPSMRGDTASRMANELAIKYAEKQHRYRCMNIARNELAVAYREGERLSIEQAQEDLLLGRCKKRWVTAMDERVCEICKQMNGVTVDQGEMFILPNGKAVSLTQAHITCRCACEWIEVEPPLGFVG